MKKMESKDAYYAEPPISSGKWKGMTMARNKELISGICSETQNGQYLGNK